MVQDDQRSWPAREAAAVGARLAARRQALGLSAQDVADRCSKLGMPELTRVVISRLETGRRESVAIAELSVLAAALDVPPAELLYPVGSARQTEFLPGLTAPPWEAARWWSGEAYLDGAGVIGATWRQSAATMYREHDLLVAGLPRGLGRARYLALAVGGPAKPRSEQDQLVVLQVRGLTDIRRAMRERGLGLPPLPAALRWLDEEV